MTTTTGTTSTQSVVTSATQSLLTSLNTGSGVDTASLVTSLVQAQFAQKTAALATKADTLTTRVSAASTLKNTMSNFSLALQTLVKSGSLTTQPVSSNTAALGVSALPGSALSGLSRSISVDRLASAQSARTTTAVADRSAVIGSGTFTLTLGQATYSTDGAAMTGFASGSGTPITIDVTNASLDDIAAAINAKKAGVTATVITDGQGGSYLSLKGQTGTNQAFTLTATDDPSGGLAQFNVDPNATGTGVTGSALNAKLTVDGIQVERATNTISDLVDGVKLQLNQVTAGAITLSSTPPSAALKQAVTDFVDTYNETVAQVSAQTDPKTGALSSDSAARSLLSSLRSLSTTSLSYGVAAGVPNTLAAIGVRTNRDGTLQIDSAALDKAMTDTPDAVEAMFAYSSAGLNGLSAKLDKIVTSATSVIYGLGASITSYTAAQSALDKQKAALTDQSDQMTQRLTQQFASMNSKISAYKSTQTFLDNQIKAWNQSDN
jgi:flagellar hook-associated protein 2